MKSSGTKIPAIGTVSLFFIYAFALLLYWHINWNAVYLNEIASSTLLLNYPIGYTDMYPVSLLLVLAYLTIALISSVWVMLKAGTWSKVLGLLMLFGVLFHLWFGNFFFRNGTYFPPVDNRSESSSVLGDDGQVSTEFPQL